MSRPVLFAFVVLSLMGCGGAPASLQSNTPDPAARAGDADNGAPLTLRVRAVPGARYETRAVARTRMSTADAVVSSDARGTLVVEAVDEATGHASMVSSIESVRVDSPEVFAAPELASDDLSGVTFRRTVDVRGATVGDIEVRGTNERNAATANTVRASLEQALVRFPEGPVRVGDRWDERVSMQLPTPERTFTLDCEMHYQLAGTERSAHSLFAVLRFDGECGSGPITVEERGVVLHITLETRTRGESHLAVADGLAGVFSMHTDVRSAISGAGLPTPLVVEIAQETQTITTPLLTREE